MQLLWLSCDLFCCSAIFQHSSFYCSFLCPRQPFGSFSVTLASSQLLGLASFGFHLQERGTLELVLARGEPLMPAALYIDKHMSYKCHGLRYKHYLTLNLHDFLCVLLAGLCSGNRSFCFS